MKTKIIFLLFALILLLSAINLKAQQQPEQLNLPGDNLNLYAVMKIFQESETLELFEQKLNEENARVNNLDLNGDNYIDYIKVIDYVEKGVHYITLQVAVTPTESQDVAVFIVRKDPSGNTKIQLVGDEELYGKYYIVEPYYGSEKQSTPNPGYYGNSNHQETVYVEHVRYVEVDTWPLVRLIFLPTYVVWHSPFYWGYYPTYWHPWTPWYWHEYYGYHYCWHDEYYGHYHHGHHHSYDNWHQNYYSHHRNSSKTVYARRERGDYNSTYTKPERLSEGTAQFRKMHPERVKSDFKEPRLNDIRVSKQDNSRNGNVATPIRNEVKSGGTRKAENGQAVKSERMNGNTKSVRQETKTETVRPRVSENKDRGKNQQNVERRKAEEPKQTVKPAVKESSKPTRQEQKNDNAKGAKGSGRGERK